MQIDGFPNEEVIQYFFINYKLIIYQLLIENNKFNKTYLHRQTSTYFTGNSLAFYDVINDVINDVMDTALMMSLMTEGSTLKDVQITT